MLREEILKRGYTTQKIRPVACTVDVNDSYVVHYNGVIYKCPAFIGKKGFEAGHVETGVADYRGIYKKDYWKNAQCAECSYLPLCFGGCRFVSSPIFERGKSAQWIEGSTIWIAHWKR